MSDVSNDSVVSKTWGGMDDVCGDPRYGLSKRMR
jgi:hypothetical protein